MRWNRYFISALLLLSATKTMAEQYDKMDSIYVSNPSENRYDTRVLRYRRHWAALIPTQFVVQNAGNMGAISAGVGWNYGKRGQWETHLLFGVIPKHQSSRTKVTSTLKENFIPWSFTLKNGWSIEPLSASFYINTVFGNEFWKSQPARYPDKYYEFMSTKFRLNIAIGQRATWKIPRNKRKLAKSISLFYEVSTCDLYLRSKIIDSSVPLKDVLGLSLGIKLQTL